MSEKVQFDIPSYVTIVQLEQTTDEDHCYIAYHPELPNCLSQGATPEEARENLVEATELTIAHLLANNLPVPVPMSQRTAHGASVQVINSVVKTNINDLEVASSDVYHSTEKKLTGPSVQVLTLQPIG
jgi:predicted RNase H-like HicB family nuclease